MKHIKIFAAILFSLLTMIQCSSSEKATLPAGSSWELLSITAGNGATLTAPAAEEGEEAVSITFGDSLQINGYSGCNYYFGVYNQGEENSLSLEMQGITRRAGKNMEFEQQFISALQNVKSYIIEENSLILSDSLGNQIMTFSARTEPAKAE